MNNENCRPRTRCAFALSVARISFNNQLHSFRTLGCPAFLQFRFSVLFHWESGDRSATNPSLLQEYINGGEDSGLIAEIDGTLGNPLEADPAPHGGQEG
jgi:hypothetical protein